jgi:hypothetical protein
MVHPSSEERERLLAIAREIRDTGEESGYAVDEAIARHEAFSRGRAPANALERSLIVEAAERGAHAAGMHSKARTGGLELISSDRGSEIRYRVKRGRPNKSGDIEFICASQSSLLVSDPDTLIPCEKWILGYDVDENHALTALLAGRIVSWTGDGPVTLILDSVIDLMETPPPSGFVSTDEGLEGFGDDFGEESGLG